MIEYDVKDYNFGKNNIKSVILLGHAIYVNNGTSSGFTLNLKDRENSISTAKKEEFREFVEYLLDDVLVNGLKCGDNEQDYSKAIQSNNEHLLILVGLNGIQLEKLSKDPRQRVRCSVLRYIAVALKQEIPVGNINYVDEMVNDVSELVRVCVVKIANNEHLDILINDKSAKVINMMAKKGYSEHIEIMLNRHYEDVDILQQLALNINASDDQLSRLIAMPYESISLKAAERGYFHPDIANSNNLEVRVTFIRFCSDELLEKFYDDPEEKVRAQVARRGAFHHIYENDDSELVQQGIVLFFEKLRINDYKEARKLHIEQENPFNPYR